MSKSFSKAPPVPFEEVQKILQEELGRPIDNVLKPGIEDFLVADLNFIYDVSRIFEFLSLEFGRTSLELFLTKWIGVFLGFLIKLLTCLIDSSVSTPRPKIRRHHGFVCHDSNQDCRRKSKKIWRCTHGPDQRPERQMNKPDIEFLNSKIFANLCFSSFLKTIVLSLLSLCEATPKHLDLSRLLSIESCGVLNPPSFHSISFAKLESDTHPASKAPSQSTSIIN
ncbi:hypothetical protein F2Q68_00036130 [Brassica cretica]|uniref:Uncharacterized protein n=1 Tax=Brassica cretica TaxID=69181 RepID=A0A8S9H4A6_BRACR|nr:hypothetical protein F2Q68_00036130 [Brassica cretica]